MPMNSRFIAFSRWAGVGVITIGAMVLVGWALDIEVFKSVLPGLVSMKANTAAAMLLAGIATVAASRPTRVARSAIPLGIFVALLGAATLAEHVFELDWGIDQILFHEPAHAIQTSHPGRMAPATAFNFMLIGVSLALLTLSHRRTVIAAQTLASIATVVALFALVGYGFNAPALYSFSAYTSMALHTSVAFFILGLGVLASRPDHGITSLISSEAAGGRLVRRLIPVALLIPFLLGWLRLLGENAGLYGAIFGIALMIVSQIALLLAAILFIGRDLDRADMARERAHRDFKNIFEFSRDLICIAGFDRQFKALNPAWSTTLGYSHQEMLNHPFLEFVHPDDRDRTTAEAAKLAEGGITIEFENRYRVKDGSWRNFLWSATPYLPDQLIYATAKDITEKKKHDEELKTVNAQLRSANQDLESFTYSVSHDLRSPLRAVDGFSRILLEEYASKLDEEGKRLLGIVRANTIRMGQLIDDLLNFSRLGRKRMEFDLVEMTPIVRRAIEDLQAEEPERVVEVTVEDLPDAYGDQAMIRQVWINLLSNAFKYTRKIRIPQVQVRGGMSGGKAKYEVRDNGAGFDMRYAGKLFGVFQRLHSQLEFEGTGVGLALAQRIVTRHGGRIEADAAPGRGATFKFTLPARPASAQEKFQKGDDV